MKPNHLVIIPDGNRRWAKKKGFSPWKGHEQGAETLKKIAKDALDQGIKYFTFWAMSKDNFEKRPKKEVEVLIKLIGEGIKAFHKESFVKEKKVAIKFYGAWREYFDKKTVKELEKIQEDTKKYTKHQISILLVYDGKEEITKAIQNMIKEVKDHAKINFQRIKEYLWTKDLPEVDLIIRTGVCDDPHLSGNMLMLQTGYSQLYFTPTYWPDFNKKELITALNDFEKRERRIGV